MIEALLRLVLRAVLGEAAEAATRRLARVGARLSIMASVVAYWLAAYVLWTFAGGLALRYGALTAYDGPLFAVIAVVAGLWHYRTYVRAGRQQALVVFVGVQLAWLVIVLARNGAFRF